MEELTMEEMRDWLREIPVGKRDAIPMPSFEEGTRQGRRMLNAVRRYPELHISYISCPGRDDEFFLTVWRLP